MKSVLISTRPKWCEKICRKIGEQNGIPVYLKPVEVRKSAPKEVPFKAYLYCTNSRFDITDINDLTSESVRVVSEGRGKVIGEFICDKVIKYEEHIEQGGLFYTLDYEFNEACQLDNWELHDYGKGKPLYGWHISDLKIYDKPRELGEFSRYGYKDIEHIGSGCVFCGNTQCEHSNPEEVVAGHYIPPICKIGGCTLKRVPQSWQYVEQVAEK